MYFVYFLRSQSTPDKTYIGYTKSLVDRLEQHNNGNEPHSYTRRYRPWEVEAYVLAETEEIAQATERYFKNASGQEKFRPYADYDNPRDAFFRDQREGRKFGRSSFKVKRNDIVLMSDCD